VVVAATAADGGGGRALVLADGIAIALLAVALTIGLRQSNTAT